LGVPNTEIDPDLFSKDRVKSKRAVQRLLRDKVKNDWSWTWPPVEAGSVSIPVTTYIKGTTRIPDPNWRERTYSPSDVEDEDFMDSKRGGEGITLTHRTPMIRSNLDIVALKKRRQRRLLKEIATNDGLACFQARRDAWTGARRVHAVKADLEAETATSPAVELTGDIARISPSESDDPTLVDDGTDEDDEWEDDLIEVPVTPSILPPETPMRLGITPKGYQTIYDRVITQGQTPSCPINLAIMLKCCQEGWQRDGEWPPKGRFTLFLQDR
jgi:hypothetical protein